jgi:(2Fe-2S) ferredoxin
MTPFELHLFVCQNRRPAGHPKGSCAEKNAGAVAERLRELAFEAGLKGRVRVNSAGCLGHCAEGLTLVVYPEAVWYGNVTRDDAEEIFREHVLGGRPVTRLRIDGPDPA